MLLMFNVVNIVNAWGEEVCSFIETSNNKITNNLTKYNWFGYWDYIPTWAWIIGNEEYSLEVDLSWNTIFTFWDNYRLEAEQMHLRISADNNHFYLWSKNWQETVIVKDKKEILKSNEFLYSDEFRFSESWDAVVISDAQTSDDKDFTLTYYALDWKKIDKAYKWSSYYGLNIVYSDDFSSYMIKDFWSGDIISSDLEEHSYSTYGYIQKGEDTIYIDYNADLLGYVWYTKNIAYLDYFDSDVETTYSSDRDKYIVIWDKKLDHAVRRCYQHWFSDDGEKYFFVCFWESYDHKKLIQNDATKDISYHSDSFDISPDWEKLFFVEKLRETGSFETSSFVSVSLDVQEPLEAEIEEEVKEVNYFNYYQMDVNWVKSPKYWLKKINSFKSSVSIDNQYTGVYVNWDFTEDSSEFIYSLNTVDNRHIRWKYTCNKAEVLNYQSSQAKMLLNIKTIEKIDSIVSSISKIDAEKVYSKIWNLTEDLRNWQKYKNLLDYLEAELWLQVNK